MAMCVLLLQDRLQKSKDMNRYLEPGRIVLVCDPTSQLPSLGLICGMLMRAGARSSGSDKGAAPIIAHALCLVLSMLDRLCSALCMIQPICFAIAVTSKACIAMAGRKLLWCQLLFHVPACITWLRSCCRARAHRPDAASAVRAGQWQRAQRGWACEAHALASAPFVEHQG